MQNVKFDFSKMVVQSGENLGIDKLQKHFYKAAHLVGLVDGKIMDLCEIRIYGTGKTNTAILWMHSPVLGLYGSSKGHSGGYGYNREDAAIQRAIEGLGVDIEGYATARDFFESLAKHLGVSVYSILESHA